MQQTSKIIIVDNLKFIISNLEQIKKISMEENAKILPLSDSCFLYIKRIGLPCVDYRQFEYKNIYNQVYPTAFVWGKNWYKQNSRDITEFKSYSLGCFIEWLMIYFFAHILKVYSITLTALKSLQPEEVILLNQNGKDNEIVDDLRHADLGLYPFIINQCFEDLQIKSNLKVLTFPLKIKKTINYRKYIEGIALVINSFVSSAINLKNGIKGKNKKIIFFEGYRHFKEIMVSPKLSAAGVIHLQKRIGISLLSRLYLNNITIKSISQEFNLKEGEFKSNISEIKKELSGYFIYNGKNIFNFIWPRIELILRYFLPQVVARDTMAVKKNLQDNLPGCVVAENDSVYLDKMVVMIAKSLNIPTVVIQNGAVLYGDSYKDERIVVHDFYPLSADYFFCFGKFDKDFFINKKESAKKIVITGGPRFDCYYKNKTRSNKTKKTVLIILSEVWFDEGVITQGIRLSDLYKHMENFLQIAKANADINFIVRPHESAYLWDVFFKAKLKELKNLTFTRDHSLEELLPSVDLVIGYVTTALIEALICRIPVFSIDTGEYKNYLPLWEFGLSKRVTDFKELDKEIKNYFDNGFKEFINEEKLKLVNYNNDGLAADRIAGYLKEILDKREINV